MYHIFTSVHTCVKYTYICIYPTPREWRNWVVWLVQAPGKSYLFVLCVHTYVCMCVMLTCISICLIFHIHAYICIRIDLYVWIYAYKYEYTCKYVFTYIRQAPGDEGIQSHGTEKAGTYAYIHNKICAYTYIYIHIYQQKKRHSHLHICSFILQAADDEGIQSYGMGKAGGMCLIIIWAAILVTVIVLRTSVYEYEGHARGMYVCVCACVFLCVYMYMYIPVHKYISSAVDNSFKKIKFVTVIVLCTLV